MEIINEKKRKETAEPIREKEAGSARSTKETIRARLEELRKEEEFCLEIPIGGETNE